MKSAESTLINGNKLTRNTTFLTKKLLSTTLLAEFEMASAIKNQGIMPATNHKMNGKFSTGTARKPTLNTSHIMQIVTTGLINAHKIPKYDPRYRTLISLIANEKSNLRFRTISHKNPINDSSFCFNVYFYLSFVKISINTAFCHVNII